MKPKVEKMNRATNNTTFSGGVAVKKSHPSRQGSVLILVAGILVLLFLVGVSYLSRTRTERDVSIAVRSSGVTEDRANVIRDQIASEIAEALFPRPLDPADPRINLPNDMTEDPNYPRRAIFPTSPRYAIDPTDFVDNRTGLLPPDGLPDYPWNFAPYSVKPWTNWPDFFRDPLRDLNGDNLPDAPRVDDIPGNPGTSDTRWLADTEPARWLAGLDGVNPGGGVFGMDNNVATPDTVEFFSHWLHMSNPMRPDNGWMVVPDISDIEGSVNYVMNLPLGPYGAPFEQWLPHSAPGTPEGTLLPPAFDRVNGKTFFPRHFTIFWDQWGMPINGRPTFGWFNDYERAYLGNSSQGIPGNFYKLSDCGFDLDGDGSNERLEIGERPQDEFAGPGHLSLQGTPFFATGAPRWHISRILPDTDGDGYTDSFWFLAPSSIDDEIRTLVGVRVIDASGLLNVNVATQFVRGIPQPGNNLIAHGTRGWTPSEGLALYERRDEGLRGVGLLGNPEHWESFFPDGGANDGASLSPWGPLALHYDGSQWDGGPGTILGELGRETPTSPGMTNDFLANPYVRLDYWRRAGSRPFDPQLPTTSISSIYTPFTLADELELRMFHGCNVPWILSRLERAFQTNPPTGVPNSPILRANVTHTTEQYNREETSEYLDELDVRPTAGAPFDELLHDLRHRITTFNGARNETRPPSLWRNNERRKFDLRESRENAASFTGRLRDQLLYALSEDYQSQYFPQGAFGTNPQLRYYYQSLNGGMDERQATAHLAAALAANMASYRDATYYVQAGPGSRILIPDQPYSRDFNAEAIPIRLDNQNMDLTLRYLGMEAQPFIVEAFIGHIYGSQEAQFDHPGINGAPNGDHIVCVDSFDHTIVAVQIANPYDQPIDLTAEGPFILSVFEQDYELRGTLDAGAQRTYWMISEDQTALLDALDIRDSTITIDNEEVPSSIWSNDREDYDEADEEHAVELKRLIGGVGGREVLIDRIDIVSSSGDPFANDFEFGEGVTEILSRPPHRPTATCNEPPPGDFWVNAINIGSINDKWIHWARVSRAWEKASDDKNSDGRVDDNHRIPRYVFAVREVDLKQNGTAYSTDGIQMPPDTWFGAGLGKPTRFAPLNNTGEPDINGIKDKNVELPDDYDYLDDISLQMNQKDFAIFFDQSRGKWVHVPNTTADFEHVGEILNVFMYGHLLETPIGGGGGDVRTVKTFAEHMIDGALVGMDARVNRLRVEPTLVEFDNEEFIHSNVLGIARDTSNNFVLADLRNAFPDLPAGARVLDLFVCEGPGFNAPYVDADGDTSVGLHADGVTPIDPQDVELQRFGNAMGYEGRMTPGLININTASREVKRALPNGHRFVHETDFNDNTGSFYTHLNPSSGNYQYSAGLTRFLEAAELYSERLGDISVAHRGHPQSQRIIPMYGGRGLWRTLTDPNNIPDRALDMVRGERGFESIGEVTLLDNPGRINHQFAPEATRWDESWRTTFGGLNPLRDRRDVDAIVDLDVSTDAYDPYRDTFVDSNHQEQFGTDNFVDKVAGDVEEMNMLFSGISNLITTRSDVFIVYLKVRSVKKDPATGIWDGTNPELIADDARYVMIVDRSQVNSVTDKPRIVLFEKLSK